MTETSWRGLYNRWQDALARCVFLARVGAFDGALAELDCARRIQNELTVVEQGLFAEMEAGFVP